MQVATSVGPEGIPVWCEVQRGSVFLSALGSVSSAYEAELYGAEFLMHGLNYFFARPVTGGWTAAKFNAIASAVL